MKSIEERIKKGISAISEAKAQGKDTSVWEEYLFNLIQNQSENPLPPAESLHSVETTRRVVSTMDSALMNKDEAENLDNRHNLVDRMEDLHSRAASILRRAERAEDFRTALGAIREARACLELLGRLQGELKEGETVNILISHEWIELRAIILETLEPYPDARMSVTKALEDRTDEKDSD